MRLSRRLLANPLVQSLVCKAIAGYLRLVHATGKWQIVGEDIPNGFAERGKPLILSFWHGRLVMMGYSWRHSGRVTTLISGHRDGRLFAGVLKEFGFATVTGSASRGGAAALKQMVRILRQGGYVAITPDGPRGPRMRARIGVVTLAKLSGAAILPGAFSARRVRVFDSWDRFVLPLPFGRGVFVWGEPIRVPRDADEATLEALRRRVERETTAVTRRADALTGLPGVDPAPAALGGAAEAEHQGP